MVTVPIAVPPASEAAEAEAAEAEAEVVPSPPATTPLAFTLLSEMPIPFPRSFPASFSVPERERERIRGLPAPKARPLELTPAPLPRAAFLPSA